MKLALIKSICVIGKIYVKSHFLFFPIHSHLQSEYQQGHLNEGHAKSSSRKKMGQSTQLKLSLKVVLCCLYSPGIWTKDVILKVSKTYKILQTHYGNQQGTQRLLGSSQPNSISNLLANTESSVNLDQIQIFHSSLVKMLTYPDTSLT